MEFIHEPVLLQEVLEWMDVKPDGVYCDGTLGGGGHSGAMLRLSGGTATIDRIRPPMIDSEVPSSSCALAVSTAASPTRRVKRFGALKDVFSSGGRDQPRPLRKDRAVLDEDGVGVAVAVDGGDANPFRVVGRLDLDDRSVRPLLSAGHSYHSPSS